MLASKNKKYSPERLKGLTPYKKGESGNASGRLSGKERFPEMTKKLMMKYISQALEGRPNAATEKALFGDELSRKEIWGIYNSWMKYCLPSMTEIAGGLEIRRIEVSFEGTEEEDESQRQLTDTNGRFLEPNKTNEGYVLSGKNRPAPFHGMAKEDFEEIVYNPNEDEIKYNSEDEDMDEIDVEI